MATEGPVHKAKFEFIGGCLCLDFCNTMGGKRGAVEREFLHHYSDLVRWVEQAHLASHSTAEALREKATLVPEAAEEITARARELREAIFRIFFALSHHRAPLEKDFETLNGELARGLNRLRVGRHGRDYAWQWSGDPHQLDHMLTPIARSAADLLISGNWRGRIRQCHADNCGWLFLDSTKNHSRRWCDMRDCGNRAKVRRHRLRKMKRIT